MKSIKVHDLNPFDAEDLKVFKAQTPSIMYHLFPLIAAIQPKKGDGGFSASRLFQDLKSVDTIKYINGEVKSSIIQSYLFTLHDSNTSAFLKPSQARCTELSCAVPLALYAFKHQYDIKYMDWDHEDPLFPRLVPKGLAWAINAELPQYTLDEVRELRNRTLLERSSGELKPVTAYKMEKSNDPIFDALPKLARFLLLQTWIYNPAIRSPNMVTNVTDWDDLATPIDNVTVQPTSLKDKEAAAVKRFSIDNLPW